MATCAQLSALCFRLILTVLPSHNAKHNQHIWNITHGTTHIANHTWKNHTSHITHNTSHITNHTLHITHHISNIMHHTANITHNKVQGFNTTMKMHHEYAQPFNFIFFYSHFLHFVSPFGQILWIFLIFFFLFVVILWTGSVLCGPFLFYC